MTEQQHKDFWAGGFLYNPGTTSVFLHHRDGNTPINPHKWGFFGGQSEVGETYTECFIRELHEEIGLKVSDSEVRKLCEYMHVEAKRYRVVYYVESDVSEDQLVLGEGAGFAWIKLGDVRKFDLSDRTREDLEYFVQLRLSGRWPASQ